MAAGVVPLLTQGSTCAAVVQDHLVGMDAAGELEPGEVSLHDAWLLHGSRANTSSRRRAGVAATFMPAESYFFRDRPTEGARKGGLTLDYAQRPLFLVRGDPAAVHPDNTLVRLELLRGGD